MSLDETKLGRAIMAPLYYLIIGWWKFDIYLARRFRELKALRECGRNGRKNLLLREVYPELPAAEIRQLISGLLHNYGLPSDENYGPERWCRIITDVAARGWFPELMQREEAHGVCISLRCILMHESGWSTLGFSWYHPPLHNHMEMDAEALHNHHLLLISGILRWLLSGE